MSMNPLHALRLAAGRLLSNGRNDGPPDLDELWRDFNKRLSGLFAGRGGDFGGRGVDLNAGTLDLSDQHREIVRQPVEVFRQKAKFIFALHLDPLAEIAVAHAFERGGELLQRLADGGA